MKTIWSFDLGKASIGEAVRGERISDRLVLFARIAEHPGKAEERSFRFALLKKLTLLNRCIRLADRETVCAI